MYCQGDGTLGGSAGGVGGTVIGSASSSWGKGMHICDWPCQKHPYRTVK